MDRELLGLWSVDARYGPCAQSDEWLIFMPDGTGRHDVLNWVLCSAETFRWDADTPGMLHIIGERLLQVSKDGKRVVEKPSSLGDQRLPCSIAVEDTPSGKRMRVLRLPPMPFGDCFGFDRLDLSGLEQPDFGLDSDIDVKVVRLSRKRGGNDAT